MTFIKGQKAWNKGKKNWWKNPAAFKKGMIPWNKGKKMSDNTRKRMSKARIGKTPWNKGKSGVMKSMDKHPQWNGGKSLSTQGYITQRVSPNKTLLQHRIVMEKYLRRKLEKKEYIHHKNGIKTDNRVENLELMTDKMHGFIHNSPHIAIKQTTCEAIVEIT